MNIVLCLQIRWIQVVKERNELNRLTRGSDILIVFNVIRKVESVDIGKDVNEEPDKIVFASNCVALTVQTTIDDGKVSLESELFDKTKRISLKFARGIFIFKQHKLRIECTEGDIQYMVAWKIIRLMTNYVSLHEANSRLAVTKTVCAFG